MFIFNVNFGIRTTLSHKLRQNWVPTQPPDKKPELNF